MAVYTYGVFIYIIVGLIAGWAAGLLLKSRGYVILGDIILGVIGAVLGGFIIGAVIRVSEPFTNINLVSLATALAGAVVTIAAARMYFRFKEKGQ